MVMAFIMFSLWQVSGDKYKSSFDTCSQAYYQGSEFRQIVDSATDKARREYPLVAGAAPIAYAVGVRREVRLSTRKITFVPDTTATYLYNHNTRSGSVGITWSF